MAGDNSLETDASGISDSPIPSTAAAVRQFVKKKTYNKRALQHTGHKGIYDLRVLYVVGKI